MSSIRLDKLLSNLGYCSRKEAALLVKKGRVVLQGRKLERADEAIPLKDVQEGHLLLEGEKLDPLPPFTLMLHKPAGFICSHEERGRLVYDLLPERWKLRNPQLSCIGRLDKDSTGQVILTDDGDLLHRIIHPKSHTVKHYRVALAAPLQGNEREQFATGAFMLAGDHKPLKPAIWQATGEREGIMQLKEGRYHQIRRMFETLGNKVIALHRYQTGNLSLGDIAEGEFRILSPEDIQTIFITTA